MREPGAPSTEGMVAVWCPPHRGLSWSHHPRSRATQRGHNAKAAPKRGGQKRGQGHYRGRSPCVRMYGAPATSAGTPRRLRAQEPRPGSKYKAGAPESPARGLRRTAVGRAPRATSTPPRAALPPRLASYNGTVGRVPRARLSPPRHPTPLLSGTCLTSAVRPPLRGMLATEGPGPPEGYPGPFQTAGIFDPAVPSLV